MYRYLSKFLAAALTLLLGVLLLATIYFTWFDLEWIAFLAGVLFAAIAATASQASKAQWLVARRTRQLQRAQDALAAESAQREHAAEALRLSEARLKLISEALSLRVVFVDRDERCRYHNPAFGHWTNRDSSQIDGQQLRDVVGDEIYQSLQSHSADVFVGKETRFKAEWRQPGGEAESCAVTLLLSFPPGADRPDGFYALITGNAGAAAPVFQAADPGRLAGEAMNDPQEGGGTFYLESIAEEQPIDLDDPRAQLVRALQEDQFILFAQPIQPVGAGAPWPRLFEILLRLQEEEQNMTLPGGVILVVERYNLLMDIDRWVVRNLITWCVDKQRNNPAWKLPVFCVNLATASLCDPEFALYVRSELQRQKYPAANLCFEIAEPDVMNHHAAAQAFMSALRPLGCRFTLEGFGTTSVSFEPLKNLPFDLLKIDSVITKNILTNPADLARTRTLALSSHDNGFRTIAEFVENDDTLAKLREIGVDYAQGFGIGRPGPLTQVS